MPIAIARGDAVPGFEGGGYLLVVLEAFLFITKRGQSQKVYAPVVIPANVRRAHH